MKQLYTLLLMLPAMLFAQTDIDFQSISSGLPGPNWTWTADQTDTSFDAVDNPSATGINTSSKVGELTAAAGSVAYALAYSDGIGSFTFDANNTTVKIMVYKSRISPIEIKFEDASDASVSVSRTVSNTVINDWEELTFDFYSAIGNTSYGKIVIIPDNLARTEANITYFDNITFTAGVAPVGPSVAAPTPPTRDAADVVSFYSDAYATAAMEEYFPSWIVGTVSDNPINGNNTWKMDGLGFAALANYGGIDLSTMEKMYIDYYTTQDVVGAKLFVKLVDTNDDPNQELLLDLGAVTAGSWQTVEIDLSAQNTANIDLSTLTQFLIDPSTDGDTFFIDNWYFAKGSPTTPATAPTTAPAAPTLDAADVISFYSDSYTNIAFGEYFPSWSQATVTDYPIDGNSIWKMEALNFASVTQYAGVDLSGMNKMYIDYWTTQDVVGAKLFVKLVDTNDSQEVLLDLGDVTAGSWQTVEVDLTAQNTANIDLSTVTQFLIDPSTDGGTFFIDNWYFANASSGPAPTEPTTAPAAPTLDAADVISFYSDSYTNIAFGEYFPSWSQATVTDYPIDGNSIWKMEALNFASVTQYAGVDLSGMNKMYIDYWTTQDVVGAKLFVKLVDTNDSQEVLLDLGDVTAGSWQTVEVDLTAQNTANIDLSTVTQFLIDPSTDGGTFFIDNWYFANVPEPGPSASAPTPPARNAADVISLYSDAYTDVASNFDAGWCGANSVSEISVAGNATTAYLGNACQGIVLNAGVDASAFTNLHVDIYIEAGTDLTSSVFNLKFVNQPGGAALEMNLNVASSPALIAGQWLSVDLTVDLTNFTGFKEFGITSNLNNKVWYDNLYAYKGTPLGINEVNSFSVVTYPNPVENTLNVSAGISVDSVSIFDITGREVLRAKPNATAFSLDVADLNKGLYLVTVKAGKQELTTKLVK